MTSQPPTKSKDRQRADVREKRTVPHSDHRLRLHYSPRDEALTARRRRNRMSRLSMAEANRPVVLAV